MLFIDIVLTVSFLVYGDILDYLMDTKCNLQYFNFYENVLNLKINFVMLF